MYISYGSMIDRSSGVLIREYPMYRTRVFRFCRTVAGRPGHRAYLRALGRFLCFWDMMLGCCRIESLPTLFSDSLRGYGCKHVGGGGRLCPCPTAVLVPDVCISCDHHVCLCASVGRGFRLSLGPSVGACYKRGSFVSESRSSAVMCLPSRRRATIENIGV